MKFPDPTREEIDAYLTPFLERIEADKIDAECAIFWFAVQWANGQSSNLYEVECSSEYKPGRCENGPEDDSVAAWILSELEYQFCRPFNSQLA